MVPPTRTAHVQERGFAQDRFAAHAGLDRSYVGQVERGEKNVTLSTILRLAAALTVDPGELTKGLTGT